MMAWQSELVPDTLRWLEPVVRRMPDNSTSPTPRVPAESRPERRWLTQIKRACRSLPRMVGVVRNFILHVGVCSRDVVSRSTILA